MKSILSALIGASLVCCAIQANAEEPTLQKVQLDIARQSLTAALNAWAEQTGFQLICLSPEVARDLTAPKVKGAFTATGALEQLLAGTPLVYAFTSERTVTVRARFTQASSTTGQLDRVDVPRLQLAALDAAEEPPARGSSAAAERAANPTQGRRGAGGNDSEQLEEVVVTGTHIRGLANITSPVVVLSRAYIESTGISTTSRLIESLPQNFTLASQAGVLVPGVSNPTEQGSSINLRGIGEGTTLTLLNGRRMASGFIGSAIDISALPLSLIDRVEVLTDGASAIYGSDAIGGVVNFVLRRDFEGAETQLRGGWADGVDEYRASQALGTAWDSGNAMLGVEYYKRGLLRASERDFVPSTSRVGSLFPEDENYSAMFSARQNLGDKLSVFADALYTRRDTYHEGGQVRFGETFTGRTPQVTTALGLNWALAGDWVAEVSAGYARNELNQEQRSNDLGLFLVDSVFDVETAQFKVDGSLFELPGGAVRGAFGIDWRSEALFARSGYPSIADSFSAMHWDQVVRSAFGEVRVPIVGAETSRPGVRRLELSLAGRYDKYSNFGSSFDPQIGLMWEPVTGFRVRSAFGTSYKAPKLTDYDLRFNSTFALYSPDPGAPSGVSHQLWVFGVDDEYSAQESESWSFGIDFVPQVASGLTVGLNYYRIKYEDRIADPPSPDILLLNPDSFSQFIVRDPTAAQINDYLAIGDLGQGLTTLDLDGNIPDPNFTPDSLQVIIDGRRRNISELETSGIDTSIKYDFRAGRSEFQLGLNGTYILEIKQRVTSNSTPFNTVDTFFNPPHLRLRGNVGWQYQPWAANLFVNHTGSYTDNRTSIHTQVSSNTTIDAHVSYSLGDPLNSGFWSGVTLALSAQNLLDEDPPHTAVVARFRDMGFDPTNGNPMGRLLSIQLSKIW